MHLVLVSPADTSRGDVSACAVTSLEHALDRWGRWQKAKGLSQRTITERHDLIVRFAIRTGRDPITATVDDVIEFLALIRPLSRNARATYYGHLRAWFCWLVKLKYRDDDPCMRIDGPTPRRGQPRPISDEQFARLLATRMHARTRMMIKLAAFQGLRAHEIAKVSGLDIDPAAETLRVIGKGETDYLLPLHPEIAAASQYGDGWWFPTHIGNATGAGHITAHAVSNIVSRAMTRAGIPGGVHRLRHWYGTHLVAAGVNLRIVQELMRHASVQSTQIYTQVSFEQQRQALRLLTRPCIAA